MTRPSDWSALGLSSDPTPGDPDQVQDVFNLINSLATDYQTILDTINKVNGYATTGNLVGATADALKAQMNGRITRFVQSAQTAFSQAAPALQTYINALNDHQGTADSLLTQAQNSGLKSDDPKVKGWATSANQAGSDLKDAEGTAAKAIQNLPGPSDPLSPWQEFLQILGWIALLLILPAMIFGGVIALVEFVVNAILFVNALVEFAQGNLSLGGLLLAALGVIAPTTRGISLGELADLVKGIGSFIKGGFVDIRAGLTDFMDLLNTTNFSDLVTVENLMKLGNFVLKGGVWVFTGLKDLPSTLITAGTTFAAKLADLIVAGGLKIFTSVRTGSFLSLILPIDAVEVQRLGLLEGLRLGFLDRGLGITADPVTNLSNLNKLALAGVRTGEFHFAGFSYLDVPRPAAVNLNLARGLDAAVPKLNTDFTMASLDAHLEASHVSLGNLAAGFTHGSLEIGAISMRMPRTALGLNHLELPDLRFPKELNNIGQGTVIAKMNDLSFVTVHEDKLPANLDVNTGAVSVPTLHTADLSVPSIHAGNVNVAAVHTADVNAGSLHAGDLNLPGLNHLSVPNLGASSVHTAGNLRVSVPTLHLGNLSTTDLHAVDLASSSATRLPTAQDMPNLTAIAHTQVNVAETHGLAVTQTGAGVRIESTTVSAGTGHIDPAGAVHLSSPDVGALQHLAPTETSTTVHLSATTPTPHLDTPQIDATRLAADPHGTGVPAEIRALQTNPEIAVHAGDAGMHVDIREAQIGIDGTVKFDGAATFDGTVNFGGAAKLDGEVKAVAPAEIPTVTVHTEQPTTIPAVSSSSVDETAAHSAGARGTDVSSHFTEPDLAGVPGLIDPNAERLAVSWSDFKQAQYTYIEAKAEHDLQFSGADPQDGVAGAAFNGKAPQTDAQIDAAAKLDAATKQFTDANTGLHELQTTAAALTLQDHSDLTASLLARPRLVGGARPGDRPIAVDPDTGATTVAMRPLGPDHQLIISFGADRTEFAELVNVHTGDVEVGGTLTEIDAHGGFQLHEADGWRTWQFDASGTLTVEPKQLFDHFGTPTQGLHIDHGAGLAHTANDDGTTDAWSFRPKDDGSGDFRLAIPGHDEIWQDFGEDGRMVGYGFPLQHADGHAIGHLEIDVRSTPQFHNATVVGQDGVRVPQTNAAIDGRTILITRNDGSVIEVSDRAGYGELVAAELSASLGGRDLESVHVDYADGTASFHAPGLPDQRWDFAHDDAHAGFTLTSQDGVHTLTFTADDELRSSSLTTRDPVTGDLTDLHFATNHMPGPNDAPHTFEDGDGTVLGGFRADRTAAGHFTVTDTQHGSYTDGSFTEFDAVTGSVRTQRTNLEGFGGLHVHEDHLNPDVGTGTPTTGVRGPDGTAQPAFSAYRTDAGHFIATDAHGSYAEFHGVSGEIHYQRLVLEDFNGLHVHDDHVNLTATGHSTITIRDADDAVLGHFDATRYGDEHFMVTDLRPGHTQDTYTEFHGMTGEIRTRRINLERFGDLHIHEDHVHADPATGDPRITIRNDDNAVLDGFRGERADNGHFHVTETGPGHLPGSHVEFDGVTGTMNYRRTDLESFNGLHLHEDHINLDPDRHAQTTVRAGDDTIVGHFDITTPQAGIIRLTDNRPGLTLDAFAEFDSATGTMLTRRIHLQDSSGLRVHEDHVNLDADGNPTLSVLDGGGADVTRFTPARTADGGGVVLTDTAAAHLGDTRTFDLGGRLTGAHITILTAKGLRTGDHFEVRFTEANGTWTGRWTRVDAAVRDPRLPEAYNGSGAAAIKKNGTLELAGADKTALFTRERLTLGQELDVLKFPNGKRQWTSWDDAGHLTDSGFRRFANEDGGVDAKDVDSAGLTIRQYRVGIDGGLVRGERLPDGTFRWTRFDKDGMPKLAGTRTRPALGAFGWKDTFRTGTGTELAQEHWSAFNLPAHGGHYREHGISGDARAGFGVKPSFKEISQQGKDTGSLEVIGGGHTLGFTRYSEQRIPDFLWKWKTSKYGTIDFPTRGFFMGDSRFQVFSWVEKDAHGVEIAHGVRVATPDGSTFDFAGNGLLARSVIKLENGNKIEIGRDADGRWDTFALDPARPDLRPANTLDWREVRGDGTVAQSGIRTFEDDKTWVDTFRHDGTDYVARYVTDTGDVVHFTSDIKPRFDPGQARGARFSDVTPTGRIPSITRNSMGQLIGRTDHFDGRGAGDIVAHGDPRAGNWSWRDPHTGVDGIRVSGRNTPRSGSWDDSFTDFEAHNGLNFPVRDFRALDKGASIRAWRGADGEWRSAKFDGKGDLDAASTAFREWKNSHGFYQGLPDGLRTPKTADWRDYRIVGNQRVVVREAIDGRVRVYGDPGQYGTDVWKEYDFGSVWRQRDPVVSRITTTDAAGVATVVQRTNFLEKESFQKQWRLTDGAGRLLRYRGIRGVVMERDTFGRWRMVGTEREIRGLVPELNEFRGWNRMIREANRLEFTKEDGAVGTFHASWARISEKTAMDFLQDFLIDVGANIIITGATDGWNFTPGQWGSFFAGGAIRSGVKAGYGVLTETALKGFRDGLRNIDGGKDWNRQPYNNDKHWDNEWAGNENPQRWRAGTFDFFIGNTAVPALGSFIATLVTGSTFGFGKEGLTLDGDHLWQAAGLSLAGGLVGGLTFGAVKTFGHLSLSGRWFHQGGLPDLALTFGEKLAIDYLVNDLLANKTGLTGSSIAKIVDAGQDSENSTENG
ncbi:hypothetical protein KDL01_01065 [Actinospica durhamensis]|uniref:Uncharacterized protein n=1 Tax=Actinospica durhamensis TaxID=1508375 RepID=A0A941EK48_9ACTN|nr:hypothetical protein [Actinospica durhamensis]MBR7831828.1 hypothetical protein [Actinospica durhamensis]